MPLPQVNNEGHDAGRDAMTPEGSVGMMDRAMREMAGGHPEPEQESPATRMSRGSRLLVVPEYQERHSLCAT